MNPIDRVAIVEAIESALEGGEPIAVATVVEPGEPGWLNPGDKMAVRRDGTRLGTLGSEAIDEIIASASSDVFTVIPRIEMQALYLAPDGRAVTRRSQAQAGDAQVTLQLFEAPARLVIVGGGHVGLALATVGELTGFSVIVIDDREEFANRERFPMADQVIPEDAGEVIPRLGLDANTYVVLVSRGHRYDEEALRASVGQGAAYVGMIGSARRTGTVLRHLEEEGFDRAALDAVSTPIGLDIGAETPEEIGISILAELIMFRRGGDGGRMRRS
ncbi:MAG: XdhC/CoxI family protein [Dehalococcoidia bacterium]